MGEGTSCHKKLMKASWMVKSTLDGDEEDTPEENLDHSALGLNRRENISLSALRMNRRLHLVRYKKGQFSSPHNDAPVVLPLHKGGRNGVGIWERPLASVHVYLNHKFKGGLTTFHGEGRHLDVKPRTGSVLVFEHDLL